MRTIIVCVVLAVLMPTRLLAQVEERVNEGLSFTIKLVSPHGVLDDSSYLDATLKNVTKDCRFHIGYLFLPGGISPENYVMSMGSAILACVQLERIGGFVEEDSLNRRPLFVYDLERKFYVYMEPGQSFHSAYPVMTYDPSLGIHVGVFSDKTSWELKNYRRMRLRIVAAGILGSGIGPAEYLVSYPDGIYSNWIDLSGMDFSHLDARK